MITNKNDLIKFYNQGNKIKFIFFWSHRSIKSNVIGKQCLSQWYPSPFIIDDIIYFTAEHYMMAEKARLFKDKDSLQKIIYTKDPGEVRLIGRSIRNYSEKIWKNNRFKIVVVGNLAKFSQNHKLGQFLFNTDNYVLVEASPKDYIWGIGLSQDDPKSINPNLWKGLNLLGFALMEVRNNLSGVGWIEQ